MPVHHPPPEYLLHYVWHTLHFDRQDLVTACGKAVHVQFQGRWNRDQGPDFLNANLEIGGLQWHGNVEIHLHSKDWYRHAHQADPNYNSTILHVVLDSDGEPVFRQDGTEIPELALKGRIDSGVLHKYDLLQLSQDQIPCQSLIGGVRQIHIYSWIERLAIARMQEKAETIRRRLEIQVQDWEQVLWEEIAAMMGGPVNQEAFRFIARQVPFSVLKKYHSRLRQLEALLFGGAGLLAAETKADEYYGYLQTEWLFLREKHQLHGLLPANLRFLRMRPAAFPTIRLSQLAGLIHCFPQLIRLLESGQFGALLKSRIHASPYWESHYRFFEPAETRKKSLGKSQKEILIINTLIPMAWLYGEAHGRDQLEELIESALALLPAEQNRITALFGDMGIKAANALQSQGILQLKRHYCDQRHCLTCGIGHQVLKG